MANLYRVIMCLAILGIGLYQYIDKLNKQTALRFQMPAVEKEIEELSQQNVQLAFQLENFNNPQHLLELAKQPEYSHLKFPYAQEVMVVSSQIAKRYEQTRDDGESKDLASAKWPIYLGSHRK